MKKIFIAIVTVVLIACGGNENAENQPTDLDRTKNNDTSVVPADSVNAPQKDSIDSVRFNL